jgi:transcriptional regulator with XRE-family HTH domain
MAQGTTAVVQQRRLRADLRRTREANGHTQKQVADELGWSLSKVVRLETGATAVATADAMALIHFYGIKDQERVDEMLAVTRSKTPAWWDEYSEFYGQQFLNFLAYEDTASRLRQFQTLAVPGLPDHGVRRGSLPGIHGRSWAGRTRFESPDTPPTVADPRRQDQV